MSSQKNTLLELSNLGDLLNGSEHNKKENLEVKQPQKENDLISINVDKTKQKPLSIFGIDTLELEELMRKYLERGADFQDLQYFQKKSVSTLLSELKTDP